MRQIYGNRRQERINNNVPFVPTVYIYIYVYIYMYIYTQTHNRNVWKRGSGYVDLGPCTWFGCSERIGTDEIDFVHTYIIGSNS